MSENIPLPIPMVVSTDTIDVNAGEMNMFENSEIKLWNSANSYETALKANPLATATYDFVFPPVAPANGQILQYNGSTNSLDWVNTGTAQFLLFH